MLLLFYIKTTLITELPCPWFAMLINNFRRHSGRNAGAAHARRETLTHRPESTFSVCRRVRDRFQSNNGQISVFCSVSAAANGVACTTATTLTQLMGHTLRFSPRIIRNSYMTADNYHPTTNPALSKKSLQQAAVPGPTSLRKVEHTRRDSTQQLSTSTLGAPAIIRNIFHKRSTPLTADASVGGYNYSSKKTDSQTHTILESLCQSHQRGLHHFQPCLSSYIANKKQHVHDIQLDFVKTAPQRITSVHTDVPSSPSSS